MRFTFALMMLVLTGPAARGQDADSFEATNTLTAEAIVFAPPNSLMEHLAVTRDNRDFLHPHDQSSQRRPKRDWRALKMVATGAAIGGGIGIAYGAYYCSEHVNPDCGGGKARGARFIGSIGAAIGAGVGFAVMVIKKR